MNAGGTLSDVLKGGPADNAGLALSMKLVAINGRSFTPALLRAAMSDAEGTAAPEVELIIENSGYYKMVKVDYEGGERYPSVERVTTFQTRWTTSSDAGRASQVGDGLSRAG